MAIARRDTDWEQQLNDLMFPEKAREIRASRMPENQQTCTMCGDFCAMERGISLFAQDIKGDKKSPTCTCARATA